MVKRILIVFIFLVLLSPYILLVEEFRISSLNYNEVWIAFINTFAQSILSAGVTVVFGFLSAIGLCAVARDSNTKKAHMLDLCCLIPSFVPALFFTTAVLQVVKPFPFGIWGIVILHSLMYVGIVAIYFKTIIQSKYISATEQAYLEGSSQKQLGWAIFRSMKFEIVMIFLFVFVQCFTSFSVPLLVGHQTLTLETLIYEKIRTLGSVSDAIYISLIESVFVIGILFFYKFFALETSKSRRDIKVFTSAWPTIFVCLPLVLFLLGNLYGSVIGITQLRGLPLLGETLLPLAIKSLAISILAGVSLVIFFSALAFVSNSKSLHKFISGYIPLSTVLVALALLVSDIFGNVSSDIKVVMALTILFVPALYRLEFGTKMMQLKNQIEVARLMGAGDFLVFRKIVFPQVRASILFLSGLGAFWAIGDFAISEVIFGQEVTLALYIQNLVGAYRIELANLLVILLLLLGLFVFLLFRELNYVFDQKY